MPRTGRKTPGGHIYHVLNRGNGRARIFEDEADYAAFEKVMAECIEAEGMRLQCYCLMPNHWHMVLWPVNDGDLGRFMLRMTTMHARRWHLHRHTVGGGHVYQGPYKSFPVQERDYFLTVCRYAERNPLRARLVRMAENWRWSSLWRRLNPDKMHDEMPPLTDWPMKICKNWAAWVNQPQTDDELIALRRAVNRGQPYGDDAWTQKIAKAHNLESTLRPRGRPRKPKPI